MKCYIIRLKENEHSCNMAKECKDQAAKYGIKAEYFAAINGNNSKQYYESTGIRPAKKFKKNRPGVLGCFFSHYFLWEKCVQLNEPIIILEHDGYILKPISDSLLEQFDHVLKLDRLDPYSKNYNNNLNQEINTELSVEKYFNKSAKKTSNKIYKGSGNYFKGAYAYIIKPEGALKLIDHINQYGHLPADQQIGDNIVQTKTTVPSLARLHPWYSIGSNINKGSLTKNLKGINDE